jgi:hypothetical protein
LSSGPRTISEENSIVLRADAERVRNAARAEVEALILGTLPVAGN